MWILLKYSKIQQITFAVDIIHKRKNEENA